ncbi:MAG: tRNA (adenosine(37)-N6)-threonylcarbamoyltransferase complex ATPase subunit type 1 TsaE [Candidatus Colwellbacteria bacterium]|nr:tRNA (adenosine(37)-N6)-threonylcarbamoyltransferase complex ATPase subunit type 1 TsaE [Candidatus Colwellbacteria bacterium]
MTARFTKTLCSRRETEKAARSLGEAIRSGAPRTRALVIALRGELGAGKTVFVKSLARALGARGAITSPTFILSRAHRLPAQLPYRALHHMDWYRVRTPRELSALGFPKLMRDPTNIVAIEWPERAPRLVPRGAVSISIRHGGSALERIISVRNAPTPNRALAGRRGRTR